MTDIPFLEHIRCFMLDMDGTIYLGDRLLPGAKETFDHFKQLGLTYLILTNNSSKHRGLYGEKLRRLGLDVFDSHIFTSGEATALYIARDHPAARIYLVGTPALEEEFASHGFRLVQDDPQMAVLGFDTTLTYEKLWKLCNYVRSGLPYLATHPDFNCPVEGGYMPDIGAMIAFVEASTGRRPDVIVGKPYPPIVEAVEQKTGIPIQATCMIGDRLYTDIALGAAGVRTILTLSGETQPEDLVASPHRPDAIINNLSDLADALSELKT